ncbi:methionine adenosyltransferase [Candidatus Cyanaurora vandensis]|uniref:methionine adenosyltransferase n=1 Tax=Candidatus Cyanaurora vandensis TaxID=2714958 RepID=UPI00257CA19B|nr:methionine adenosyltransferase [Candidatus Cyanaurora vandensis]
MPRQYLFTSESVTEGHPDKICDQISDTILDALLSHDPQSRVAAETAVSTGLVLLTGEVTTHAQVDYSQLIRAKIRDIGYVHAENGFSADSCAVMIALGRQSPDIAQGVDAALEARTGQGDQLDQVGAGDQGLMFGFACNETPEMMPLPISIAHRLARQLAKVRKDGTLTYLRPDGKTQVTVLYEDRQPLALDTLLISTQHTATIGAITDEKAVQKQIRADLWEMVVQPALVDLTLQPTADKFLVNPTGKFVIGGPQGDAGLTGRKIIVDTYGGYARHGGGAFSGKDPTKVDRSAAYACRYVAKNIVKAGLAQRCEVQVAYAIGKAHPVSIMVETFGTATVDEERLELLVKQHFDLRPAAILRDFNLLNLPKLRGGRFYQNTAAYGHLGRPDLDLPWERTDKAELLRDECC